MSINISSKVYFLLILLFSVLIIWPLFLPGLFFHHDDLQVMRIFEMRKCFNDLQLPCRWVPDMGYGNGFPLFNYYSALPYYIGALASYVLSFVDSAKVLFFIPLVLGGISMFLLGQKLFNKEAGFTAAVLYMFAPYRALDSYVRGAVAESFALALAPLIFYFSLKIIEKPDRKILLFSSLSLAGFLLSHNIMTMLFIPFYLLWNILFLYLNKWQNWRALALSLILGIGLSAFFLVPAFLEKGLVQTDTLTQGGSNFRTHFVGISQLFFDRSWGYGGSFFGPIDTISFQIGWPLWWLVALSLLLFFLNIKKNLKYSLSAAFLIVLFGISIFMQHNKSAFIWEAIGTLQFTQFPWRFLSLSIFSGSLLGGYVILLLSKKLQGLAIIITVILAIVLNWQFFQPREFYPWITDAIKLSDPLWETQQNSSILDYLPKTAYEPKGRAPSNIIVLQGDASGQNYDVRSNKFSVDINVNTQSRIQIPIFDFPEWKIYSDGNLIVHDNQSDLGRITFNLAPGNYHIIGLFKNTPIRTAANIFTVISAVLLILITMNKRIYKLAA